MTLNVYSRPRTTLDIDFLALLDETDFINIKDKATTEGIQIDEEWVKWLSGNLNIPYLKRWANRLGISNELGYILNL
jgi:hypothetical protein